MPFTSGENVGPYRVIEQLGQGGMATVFKAYHAALDRHVAMKVLHPAFKEDPQFLARFHREAKVVAKLEHPNIIPIYDFSEHKRQPYLVMKFIEGETLKARLARGPLSVQEAKDVVQAVGSALNYAHSHGVLHRDVKPSNILLSEKGHIYLADFGLARIAELGASTLSGDMLIGTPYYISPEQGGGEKNLDERTDIYSFGIVLYEIIVGKVPFSADTPFSIIHDHIYTPLPLPREVNPAVPEEVQVVLLKALAKNPADRYSSGDAMVEAFIKSVKAMDPSIQQDGAQGIAPIALSAQQQTGAIKLGEADKDVELVQPSERAPSMPRWIWLVLGLLISCMALASILGVGRPQENQAAPAENQALATDISDRIVVLPSAIPERDSANDEAVDGVPEDSGLAYLQRAQAFADSGNDQAAAKQYLLAGEKLLEEGKPFEASEALVRGINLIGGPDSPSSKPYLGLLAEALYFSAGHEEFDSFLAELKVPGPRWPMLRLLEARSFLLKGEYERAERIIQEAVERDPDPILASTILVELEFAQGNYSEALAIVEETLAMTRVDGWLVEVLNDLKLDIRQALN